MRAAGPSKLLPVVRDVTVIVFAALILAIATAVGWHALVIACAGAAALLFGLLLQMRPARSRDWLLVVVLGGILVLPIVSRTAGLPVLQAWQVVLMMLSLFGAARMMEDLRESGWLRLAVGLFLLYMALGIVSSVTGRTRTLAGLYQFISDLKPMLLVMLGYALYWDERMERWLWAVVRWAWLPMLALVAFEWAAPGIYFAWLAPHIGVPSVDPSGLLPSRPISLFEHSSMLATTSVVFLLLAAGRLCTRKSERQGSGLRWVALGAVYGVLLLIAVQRQEIIACILALLVMVLLNQPERLVVRGVALAVMAVPLTALLWMAFGGHIQGELALWGFGSSLSIESPRAQIFSGAFDVAQRNHPFGSGLGTYGGAGAEKFDLSLYYDLGFTRYWWFGKQDYLMDTYWPNPIAETGFYGAACLALCYLALFSLAATRALAATGRPRRYWLCAAAMMVYVLLLSGTSPAFQDPRLFLLPAVMFGIASQCARQETPVRIGPRTPWRPQAPARARTASASTELAS